MASDSGDFLQQLMVTFRAEAQEHLQLIEAGLLALERAGEPGGTAAVVEEIFRAAHSLKGAARAVDLADVENVCQRVEETFAGWKREGLRPPPEALERMHEETARIAALVAAPAAPISPVTANGSPWRAVPMAPARPPQPAASEDGRLPQSGGMVRIRMDALDAQLLQAEEMLAVKLAAARRVRDLRELLAQLRADGGRRHASHLPGEPDREAGSRRLAARTVEFIRAAEQDRDNVGKLVDELLARAKQLVLLPFSTISRGLPRMVRDACREQGKDAELVLRGEAIEVDKRILDTLKDPLLHLLRNAIAHGIDPPSERVRRGKPARGHIELQVEQRPGSQIRIAVSDDGGGIDLEAVKSAAIRAGWLTAGEADRLPDADAHRLVFRSDLSTSAGVDRLSGRGLGLAIVQEKVVELGGQIQVRSTPGRGTTFEIAVPAIRATFRGVLVRCAARLLVLPTPQVESVGRVRADEVRLVNGRDTLSRQGRVVPIVRLERLLGGRELPAQLGPAAAFPLVLAGRDEQLVALAVDEVLDEREFLVKPLRRPLDRVRHVSAAAVLPGGGLAVVLDVPDLLVSAREVQGRAFAPASQAPPVAPPHILLAEDSITSRLLVRSILESAGYRVTTAVDGLDAWARLRAGRFDLLVSDIEMPRLDGLELSERVRADAGLAHLPVVLVTALASDRDRERGLEVGANAYIVKSSFDQDTLLEAVRRLVGEPPK